MRVVYATVAVMVVGDGCRCSTSKQSQLVASSGYQRVFAFLISFGCGMRNDDARAVPDGVMMRIGSTSRHTQYHHHHEKQEK